MKGKVTELGKKIYEEKLKPILEPNENGKFVSIEPESGEYFVAETDVEASIGNAFFKKKILFLTRIGFPAAHKIGGYGLRKRQS
jgi:hypothetical protein